MESTDVIKLSIYPFFKCNYRCIYCYLNDDDLNSDIIININRLKRLVFYFRNNKLNIEILGGEPLLKPEIINIIAKFFLENCKIKSIKISTNGSILNAYIINILKCFDEVQISLDAADDRTYKKIRGGNFNKVINNIKDLLDANINISLSFVLLKYNVNQIEDFFKLSKNLSVNKINIGYFIPFGRGLKRKDLMLSLETLEKVKRKILILSKKYEIKVKTNIPTKIKKVKYICPAGNKEFSILPDGKIVPCIFFRDIELGKYELKRIILIKNNYTICPMFYH